MRILNITQCTNLGGMEHSNLLRLIGLQRLGHACELISLNPLGDLGPLLEKQDIPAQGLPYLGRGGWRSAWLFRRAVRARRCDAIIMTGHNLMATMAIGSTAKPNRVLAIHFHHKGERPDLFWSLYYNMAVRRFKAITFVSDFIREEAEEICPSIATVAHTVPNPFYIPAIPSVENQIAARTRLGLPLSAPIIGNAGWFIQRKRFDVFLRVAAEIVRREPDARFVLAGGGPAEEELKCLASELGVLEHVEWIGWQTDLADFYRAVDIVLFNSDCDALPRTPLEGLSYGRPVVASVLRGGLHEFLQHEKSGFIFNRHDVDVLSTAVLQLIYDPARASRLAMCGRRVLSERSSIETHAKMMARLLFL